MGLGALLTQTRRSETIDTDQSKTGGSRPAKTAHVLEGRRSIDRPPIVLKNMFGQRAASGAKPPRDDVQQVCGDRVTKVTMVLANAPQPIGVEAKSGDVPDGFASELPNVRRDEPGPPDGFARADPIHLVAFFRLDRDLARLHQEERR